MFFSQLWTSIMQHPPPTPSACLYLASLAPRQFADPRTVSGQWLEHLGTWAEWSHADERTKASKRKGCHPKNERICWFFTFPFTSSSIGQFHELKLQKAKELLLLIMLAPFLHSRNYHLRLQKAAKGRPLKSAMGTCATCPRVLSNVRWPTLIQRASKTHCTNEEKRGKRTDFLRQSGIHLKRSEKVE